MTKAIVDRTPTRRDFPVMFTMKEAHEISRLASRSGRTRVFQSCRVCGLAVDPRNRERHTKACAKRKRLAPALWAEWNADMRAS